MSTPSEFWRHFTAENGQHMTFTAISQALCAEWDDNSKKLAAEVHRVFPPPWFDEVFSYVKSGQKQVIQKNVDIAKVYLLKVLQNSFTYIYIVIIQIYYPQWHECPQEKHFLAGGWLKLKKSFCLNPGLSFHEMRYLTMVRFENSSLQSPYSQIWHNPHWRSIKSHWHPPWWKEWVL